MNQCIFSVVVLGIGPTGIQMECVSVNTGPESNVALIKIVVGFKQSHGILMAFAITEYPGDFDDIEYNRFPIKLVSFEKTQIRFYGGKVALFLVMCQNL